MAKESEETKKTSQEQENEAKDEQPKGEWGTNAGGSSADY